MIRYSGVCVNPEMKLISNVLNKV